ncbi:MAG: 3'-5' exonuclease [Chloroflexi bacterium]|nr:3'-5' exonuclease [Chloroflexota bacterium]
MVADAPTMFTVRSRLRPVLGDHVLVGHNVDFDLGFLNEERLGVGNHRIDTITLAAILVPEAGRYDLESLVHYLDLPDPNGGQTHRARDDAEQTVELFLALRERALALEMWQIEEIIQAGRRIAWPETLFLKRCWRKRRGWCLATAVPAPPGSVCQTCSILKNQQPKFRRLKRKSSR